MKRSTIPARGFVCLAVLWTVACGDSSRTGPSSVPAHESAVTARSDGSDLSSASAEAPDTDAFSRAIERLGGLARAHAADVSRLSEQADWLLEILRAPKTGQVFKINRYGMFPSPAPKFRFKATTPVNIPDGAFIAFFLTAGGKECGIAIPRDTAPFAANQPRTVDIPNDYILTGPEACFLVGQNCTRTQCKFPLTTTKIHVLFGNVAQGVGQKTFTMKYKWVR